MALINYYGIQEALKTLLEGGSYSTEVAQFLIEAMDREVNFSGMPLFNIRLLSGEMEPRSLPNGYYLFLTFEIDVITFDLTHFSKAAIIRDTLMGEAQLLIQQNKSFHADIQTSTIAPEIRFGAGTPEGAGGHIAVGTFTVTVEAYIEPQ